MAPTFDETVLSTDELVRLERLFAAPATARLYRLYCRCGSTVETLETRAISPEELGCGFSPADRGGWWTGSPNGRGRRGDRYERRV